MIVGLGSVLVLGVAFAQGALVSNGSSIRPRTGILLILVALAPIDALDDMLIALFAVLGSPRAIFLRRYLIGPLLRLIVAATLVLATGTRRSSRSATCSRPCLGLVTYGAIFVRILARRGVFRTLRATPPIVPFREVLTFSVPLLSNDGVWLLVNTLPLVV